MSPRPSLFAALLGAALITGCATTHPRTPVNWELRAAKIDGIALLEPQLDVSVKYIGTSQFLDSPEVLAECRQRFVEALLARLAELGYPAAPAVLSDNASLKAGAADDGDPALSEAQPLAEAKDRLKEFQASVRGISELILIQDPSYRQAELGVFSIAEAPVLPLAAAGIERSGYAIYCFGKARLETGEEAFNRVFQNIAFNISLIPVSIATSFVPIAMPLTINLSTSFYESSPDEIWIRLALVDLASGRLIYHNDYYEQGWALSVDDVWEDVAAGLLEALPEREHDD